MMVLTSPKTLLRRSWFLVDQKEILLCPEPHHIPLELDMAQWIHFAVVGFVFWVSVIAIPSEVHQVTKEKWDDLLKSCDIIVVACKQHEDFHLRRYLDLHLLTSMISRLCCPFPDFFHIHYKTRNRLANNYLYKFL
jgi:hypothetical protein